MAQADSNHTTNAPTSRPPKNPQDSLHYRTDIPPEELFKAIGRLRKEARDEIHRLIQFLDETDNHLAIDPEAEPSLGFPESTEYWHHNRWLGPQYRPQCLDQSRAVGGSDDREGDDCCDDREDDPADGPEEVNEDGDGDPDAEPSLGWPEQVCHEQDNQDQAMFTDNGDKEEDASCLTEAALARYREDSRRGIDSKRGYATTSRRLLNLSQLQRGLVLPRLDSEEVSLR